MRNHAPAPANTSWSNPCVSILSNRRRPWNASARPSRNASRRSTRTVSVLLPTLSSPKCSAAYGVVGNRELNTGFAATKICRSPRCRPSATLWTCHALSCRAADCSRSNTARTGSNECISPRYPPRRSHPANCPSLAPTSRTPSIPMFRSRLRNCARSENQAALRLRLGISTHPDPCRSKSMAVAASSAFCSIARAARRGAELPRGGVTAGGLLPRQRRQQLVEVRGEGGIRKRLGDHARVGHPVFEGRQLVGIGGGK